MLSIGGTSKSDILDESMIKEEGFAQCALRLIES
jgi:hypothetical protein